MKEIMEALIDAGFSRDEVYRVMETLDDNSRKEDSEGWQ